MEVIEDMSRSGTLDGAEVISQFADHFSRVPQGGSGPKWVARFCKAFVAHILMGIRASTEISRQQNAGEYTPFWPAKRTVLIRASEGIFTQSYSDGASRFFDLENWASDVELYDVPGTHFSILSPASGLAEILNGIVMGEAHV